MSWKTLVARRGAAALLAAGLTIWSLSAQAQPAPPPDHDPRGVLFWTPGQREAAFRSMETYSPHAVSAAASDPRPLTAGAPLAMDVEAFMTTENVSGLLILQDGTIRMERYGLGLRPEQHWISFSMTKSIVSLLFGTAIAQGRIGGIDDPVIRYLPELTGSAYDGVTVGQLLSMTSGAAWSEDYADPHSDVARFLLEPTVDGVDPTIAYMRRLTRAAAPGQRWLYNTGETNLVGALLTRAVGKPLSTYLEETLWRPAGMENDAYWLLDAQGREVGGCCVSATLRDWGRLSLLLMPGRSDRPSPVPATWLEAATRTQADIGIPGRGYGYLFWTFQDGSYQARGIFGQTIHIDPSRRLAVVVLSAWPTATGAARSQARAAFLASVADAIDAEVDAP